jgi:hypothetical protein
VKGTDAGIKMEDATNIQCSPSGNGYECSYIFRKERDLGAVLGLFGALFGVAEKSNANTNRNDLFLKTKTGWKSPSIARHLENKRDEWDSEMNELRKKHADENTRRWQEDVFDGM